MTKVDELLLKTIEMGASDLHISAGSPPIIRLHGELSKIKGEPVINPLESRKFIQEFLTARQLEEFKRLTNIDLSYQVEKDGKPYRFRANVYMQKLGWDANFRGIGCTCPTIKELGLPQTVLKLLNFHQGLILVTGPSGCGKTTTLAALVNHLNMTKACHIVTVEDPIEYIHLPEKGIIRQREVGKHSDSYQTALKYVLREDPDVIMIGELRDPEVIQQAMTAAETGHLVLSTLPTTDAARTIDRIIDSFHHGQQQQIRFMLSEALRGVISQQLLPRKDKKGRVAAVELLIGCRPLSNIIREKKIYQINSLMQTSRNLGMQSMDIALKQLYADGLITRDVAMGAAIDKAVFI
ncbi:MAG TPA: PilT/PilU family type 4a pilus ATPase [Candidatus Eremiobacteraeota bacterium]|nr:MAG: Twitching mobility protein [bacterium ADurb.Bin363]HPZ07343.1 PilT/PilU family type 4a pilus ATPase [Candidatus Eremiobacteraeota bacterium]